MKVPIILAIAAGEYMDSATLNEWQKQVGQAVMEGEPIALVETAKATSEILAPVSGILEKIEFNINQEVSIGETLGWIETETSLFEKPTNDKSNFQTLTIPEQDMEKSFPDNEQESQKNSKRINISPIAKKMAGEMGVDIWNVIGSGPEGRIVERDIVAYGKQQPTSQSTTGTDLFPYTVIQKSSYRKVTAQRMTISANIPQFQLTIQINMSSVLRERQEWPLNDQPTITAILTKAIGLSLEQFSRFNAVYVDDEIRQLKKINVAVAIATIHGLAVPVVKSANKLSVQEVNKKLIELRSRAESQQLTQEDVADSSFTISNLGQKGIVQFSALINPPQVGILAFGTIHDAWLVSNSAPQISPCCLATLSCDHRAVDGADGAEFLLKIKQLLENSSSWIK